MMRYNNYCAMCTDSNETVMQSQPCGCGGTADTLDLGSSAERREGSNPFIRTCLRNSMVEYHTFNVRVVGSSPTGDILAEVAQLAVQRFCKP